MSALAAARGAVYMPAMDSLAVRLVAVERALVRLVTTPMRWSPAIEHRWWALDHCGFAGMHARVVARRAPAGPFARAPGTWHLYAPRVAYHEAMDRPELAIEQRWALFAWDDPPPALAEGGFASFRDDELVLPPLLDAIHALHRGGAGERIAAHGLLQAMLGHLIAAAAEPAADGMRIRRPGHRAPATALTERVDAALARRLRRPPSLAELARELGISQSSLSHRFKRATGVSVMERCRALRIDAARELLLRDGATVKSVARDLGFASAFHLSRIFTQVCGLPPAEWRRRHGAG